MRAPTSTPLLASFALTLAVAVGCGDDGTVGSETGVTTAPPATGTTGTPGTGETTDPGTSTTGTSGATTTATSDPTTGTDPTTGEPPACAFAPGCYGPTDPDPAIGLASHIPAGCDGGPFEKRWSIFVQADGYASAEAPRSIPYLGDFDNDGVLDLFVNFRKASAAYVFRGLGDGTFDGTPAMLTGGLFAGGWGGDLGDFNGDGNLDVFVGDHVRGAYAWTGNGAMGFAESVTGLPEALFSGGGLADLDGDGSLDGLLGADQFSSGFQRVAGDGGGGWSVGVAPQSPGSSNIGSFSFHDLDGDGDPDVFAFGEGSGVGMDVYVHRTEDDGFTPLAAIAAGMPNGFNADPVQGSVGDVNCDGEVDIAAGGTVLLGQGQGAWSPGAVIDDAHIAHLADMNGDGFLDLVTQDTTVGLALYLGDGSGATFAEPTGTGLPDETYQAGGAMERAYGIDIGDLDGDDTLDIVRVAGFGADFVVEVWAR